MILWVWSVPAFEIHPRQALQRWFTGLPEHVPNPEIGPRIDVGEEDPMALEDVHLDVLQNIEFAIVSVYRKQHDLRDVEVMRALDALIEVYRAEARGHTPKDMSLTGPEGIVFQRTKEMCEYRLGRQAVATRIQIPFEGDKTAHDILACLRKIRKSVDRWNKRGGQQGYLQFVSEFVK